MHLDILNKYEPMRESCPSRAEPRLAVCLQGEVEMNSHTAYVVVVAVVVAISLWRSVQRSLKRNDEINGAVEKRIREANGRKEHRERHGDV
jgi:hypothetical protein